MPHTSGFSAIPGSLSSIVPLRLCTQNHQELHSCWRENACGEEERNRTTVHASLSCSSSCSLPSSAASPSYFPQWSAHLAWGIWRNENVSRWDDFDPHPKHSLASFKPTARKGKLDNGAHAGWNQKDCWQWPAPGQQGTKWGAGSGSGERLTLCWRQGAWVQVSAPPLTCLITTGKLSVSKYLICKMGTGTMVPSSTTAWARDEGQPA